MKKVILFCIRIYQKTVSPDHGWLRVFYPQGYCRFFPSCSQYALLAVQKKGVFKGLSLAILRIIRCNPFSRGGVDSL